MPSLTIGHFCAFTPSSSKPTVAIAARMRAVGVDVEQLRAVFQLAEIRELHEARAGVVGLVADDAIELGGVGDDLVNRQREVRGHQDQILQPAPTGFAIACSTASAATRSALPGRSPRATNS